VSKDLNKEAEKFRELAASPEFQDIKLLAGTMKIKAEEALGNKSIQDLDNIDISGSLMALGSDFNETKKLAGLRENLLALAQSNQEIDNAALYTNDLSKFASLMAEAPTVDEALIKSGYSEGTMVAADSRLYAQVPSLNDIVNNSGLPANLQNKPVAKGMFIYNESLKQNEKILNYEEELSLPTTMNFIDTDKDSDKDLIYSFGSNIYLKENYNKTGSIGQWLLTGGLMAAATATWAAVAAAWAFLAPLLPIALAIGALVAVIYYFWDTIKGFFSWLGPVIDWFKKIISTIGGFFGFGKSKKVAEEAPGAPQMPASASTQTAPPSATTTAMASSGNTDGILNKIEQHLATLVSMAQKGGGGAGGGGTATLEKNKGGVLPGIDAQPVQAAANNLSEAKKALPDAKNMMLDILGIFAWIGGYAIVLSDFAGEANSLPYCCFFS
jgi:hypothetical protein